MKDPVIPFTMAWSAAPELDLRRKQLGWSGRCWPQYCRLGRKGRWQLAWVPGPLGCIGFPRSGAVPTRSNDLVKVILRDVNIILSLSAGLTGADGRAIALPLIINCTDGAFHRR